LALGVLQRGAIVVGVVSTTNGKSNTIQGGPLLVVNPAGNLVQTIPPGSSTKINDLM
jgi:hypothetical protein